MRLIDADALVKYCNGNPFITDSVKTYIRLSVATMPTIEERKTGKWIRETKHYKDAVRDSCRKEKTMGQLIDAERKVHIQIYDDEHEEYRTHEMSISDVLDTYTDEGCPDAEPSEQQWIPCSVRLPEELEEVNVTWINHYPESYYDFVKGKPFTGSAVYYKGKWYWYSSTCTDILGEYGENDIDEVDDAIEITAWKPIGEPWKGEQNE